MIETLGIVIINDTTDEHLDKCIASIKKQQYKSAKATVVGGAFNRSELLNKGIELMQKFDAILFLESTQELKDGYINKCMEALNKDSLIGAVYTDYENAITTVREYLPSFNREKITKGFCIPNTSIISSQVFKGVGIFDGSLEVLENWDMWLRISESFVLYHIPESLYINNVEDICRNVSGQDLIRIQKYILDKTKQRINGTR